MSKKIKNPIFAHGTESAIKSLIQSGEIKYPAYLWYTDDCTYNFLDKYGKIEKCDFSKLTGTLDDMIILSDLFEGIYYIKGVYKVTQSDNTIYSAGSYIIVIVGNNGNKVRRITFDEFEDYTIEDGQIVSTSSLVTSDYLEDNGYVTDTWVDEQLEALKISMKNELKAYISDILPIMVSQEIDRQITHIDNEDIDDLFDANLG